MTPLCHYTPLHMQLPLKRPTIVVQVFITPNEGDLCYLSILGLGDCRCQSGERFTQLSTL